MFVYACGRLLSVETPIVESQDPCFPSPCGPNAKCRPVANTPACSCLPSYVGRPPNCRPECTNSAECPGHLACQNEKCKDPCPGSCGINTNCIVIKHSPVCSCQEGYTGDPFYGCSVIEQGSSVCYPLLTNYQTNQPLICFTFFILTLAALKQMWL